MKLVLLGAPGAGKGTLAAYLIEKMGFPSVSTGNMLREAIKNQTELGMSAKKYMDAGELVPDEVVIGLIKDRLAQDDSGIKPELPAAAYFAAETPSSSSTPDKYF